MKLSKSGLAIYLSKLKVFENPIAKEEQYTTDSEIAASLMWQAYMSGWIENKVVADLGAGTGILGIAALILGAKKVFFVEKDAIAAGILADNLKNLHLQEGRMVMIHDDISNFHEKVDFVVQNPPFGVQKRHADLIFLEKAFEISRLVLSMHKSETKDYLLQFAGKNGFELKDELKFSFPLKQTMKFHKSRLKKIGVSAFLFEK